ncbi:MAG: ABC transporter ATP-binding protein [Hyphomonadaceae bacterium]
MLPHWRYFAAGAFCALVTSLAAVSYGGLVKLLGDLLQSAVDGAASSPDIASPETAVWWLTGLIVLAAVVRAVSLYLMTVLNNTGVQRALVDVSNHQYAALVSGDYARLADTSSGGFVSRFVHDLYTLRDAGLRLANNASKSVLTLIGALAAMIWMDWQLALILLVVYPLAFGPVVALGNRVRKQAKRSQEQMEEVTSLLSEGFQSARTVRAYGLEGYQQDVAAKGFAERARLFLKVLKNKAAVDPILEIAGGVALAGVLGFSAWRIITGASTIGDFLGFVALIAVAAPEARALGGLSALAQEASAAGQRFYEIVDGPKGTRDADDAKALGKVSGKIQFENVHFAYGKADDEDVLAGLDLTIEAGERVAIVGPSGAGKSTLFNLLMRLYDPASGRVLLDGIDLKQLRLAELRAAIGLVEQEPVVFDASVGANIGFGDLAASQSDIETAARLANADGFIAELPDGYDTSAGERGGKLSGGQKQRLALARAFLRDAPILLLDEATSALDASSEAAVQAALQGFAEANRTVIVIAHNLASVRWADRIVVIAGGRVAESGTHDELAAKGGLYAQLLRDQLA